MRAFKRLASGTSAAVLTLSTLMSMGFTGVAHAAVQTCTWTGGGTDSKFSTAANWSGCGSSAPGAGDIIAFTDLSAAKHTSGNSVTSNLTNDLNVAFGGLTVAGTSNTNYYDTYNINTLKFADGANISNNNSSSSSDGQAYIYMRNGSTAGTVTGLGDLNLNGTAYNTAIGAAIYSVPGVLQIQSGMSFYGDYSGGDTVGTYKVNSGASAYIFPASASNTITSNFIFWGGTGQQKPELSFGAYCTQDGTYSCASFADTTFTLSGNFTLNKDAYISPDEHVTANITGAISGSGKTLTVDPAALGTFTVNASSNDSDTTSGTNVPVAATNNITDDQPTVSLSVGNNTTDILDGSRGNVYVSKGGVLKGSGTMRDLQAGTGGTIAPGHSPGKLTILNSLNLYDGSTYQAELKDTADGDYDQLIVGNANQTDTTDSTGVVILGNQDTTTTPATITGNPVLAASLYDGYKIAKGDNFTIINNLSQTAVRGTFKDLPEGATFKVGTAVFSITYKGGDGNDVVLTNVTAPSTPDTGFATIAAHPAATLGISVVAAGAILMMARQMKPARATVRTRATRTSRRRL